MLKILHFNYLQQILLLRQQFYPIKKLEITIKFINKLRTIISKRLLLVKD